MMKSQNGSLNIQNCVEVHEDADCGSEHTKLWKFMDTIVGQNIQNCINLTEMLTVCQNIQNCVEVHGDANLRSD